MRGRIGGGNITEVVGKGCLQGLPWTLHQPRRQMAGHQVQGAEEVKIGMTIPVAREGPVPLDAQCDTEGGDQGEASFILAQ